jgi:hypothetical protein
MNPNPWPIVRRDPPGPLSPLRKTWRPVIGTPEQVADALDTLALAGLLVETTPPRLYAPGQIRINALILEPRPLAVAPRPVVRPVQRPVQRPVRRRPAWVLPVVATGATAVLGGLTAVAWWVLSWVAEHLWLILGGAVALALVAALLTRAIGGERCVTIHGRGCH